MIGLTLVVSMGVFASLKASFGDVISDRTNADLFVTASSPRLRVQPVGGRGGPVRAGGGRDLAQRLGPGPVRVGGQEPTRRSTRRRPRGHEPRRLPGLARGPRQGRGRGVPPRPRGPTAGSWDTVRRSSPRPASSGCRWSGRTTARAGSRTTTSSASPPRTPSPARSVTAGLVTVADGADPGDVQAAVDDALATHPDARVLDQEGYEEVASGFIDQPADLRDRDAPAGRRDRPARDRQHAGAVGVRAHPGAWACCGPWA